MKARAAFIVALVLGSAPGLAFSAAAQPKKGGTITLATQNDLVIMNPMIRTASTERLMRMLMFDSLLGIDAQGNVQPNLAESWEISPDGKAHTFRLRRGVLFHNGKEMTAEDVRFSINYTLDPKNGAYGFSRLSLVERVEAADKYVLRVYLKKPTAVFLTSLTSIQSFPVVPSGSLETGVMKPAQFPPGTGAFRFVEWVPGQRVVFERFDQHWGHKPYVDRVVIRPIADTTVRFTALQAGDVDIIERTPYEWVRQVVDGKVKGIGFTKATLAGYRRLIFNVARPPLNNKKLRQAIAYAIDKKEILDATYMGFGEPADQKYPKGHAWHLTSARSYSRDLEKAKALLKEAAYKGEVLEILSDNAAFHTTETTVLQNQLKKVGIAVKLNMVEWGAYREQQRKGNFHLMVYGGSIDPDPSLTYGPDIGCEQDLRNRSSNMPGYCDREIDALLEKAGLESDAKKRKEIFERIIAKVSDDLPELPIGYVPRFYSFRDYVKGFTTNSEGEFQFPGGGLSHAWLDK
ncbi:MAG TPA: ABC transporter substrate-binding protein [Candidatus Acidoferrales bacterium]|nr:ABC transporter substrate-binding protein [Candidatus Acidoferrales bacterium]